MLSITEKKRFETLLTKSLDNEITDKEQIEFNRFITQYKDCMKDWRQYKSVIDQVKNFKFVPPPDNVWACYWENIRQRLA